MSCVTSCARPPFRTVGVLNILSGRPAGKPIFSRFWTMISRRFVWTGATRTSTSSGSGSASSASATRWLMFRSFQDKLPSAFCNSGSLIKYFAFFSTLALLKIDAVVYASLSALCFLGILSGRSSDQSILRILLSWRSSTSWRHMSSIGKSLWEKIKDSFKNLCDLQYRHPFHFHCRR